MRKKAIYILIIFFFITSCETMNSVKRGLTGEKKLSTDEFMIEKKDPLIMPPDYENLPTPDEADTASEEYSVFENVIENSTETDTSTSRSVENSILKKIQSK